MPDSTQNPTPKERLLPIIYVRGYAMSRTEQNETAADPFCGFNLGSTVYRATPEKTQRADKFVFESPVLRLMKEYGYDAVYRHGFDIMDDSWDGGQLESNSIIIYRYYDEASSILGDGTTPDIEHFARGLADLIERVRDLTTKSAQDPDKAKQDFRCYLVAHSMGGLICRAFLQNSTLRADDLIKTVDKFFTYATPHNGIDMAGVNVPEWLTANDIYNFNRQHMADYLAIDKALFEETGRVDWIPESILPSRKVFCLVGTNRSDYEVAMGLSRTFSGHGSDGLVRIANASVWGVEADGKTQNPAATAFVFRSHSGAFGIVNSEESYQNLTRFLFGDLRVDIYLDVDAVTLPEPLQGKDAQVEAVYQIGLLVSPRGRRWYLSRRVSEEDSVACRTHAELSAGPTSVYLSTMFLSERFRPAQPDPRRPEELKFGVTLDLRVPDYELDHKFWFNDHFEGASLFTDTFAVSAVEPDKTGGDWSVEVTRNNGKTTDTQPLDLDGLNGGQSCELKIPFKSPRPAPAISGKLRFVLSQWNEWLGPAADTQP